MDSISVDDSIRLNTMANVQSMKDQRKFFHFWQKSLFLVIMSVVVLLLIHITSALVDYHIVFDKFDLWKKAIDDANFSQGDGVIINNTGIRYSMSCSETTPLSAFTFVMNLGFYPIGSSLFGFSATQKFTPVYMYMLLREDRILRRDLLCGQALTIVRQNKDGKLDVNGDVKCFIGRNGADYVAMWYDSAYRYSQRQLNMVNEDEYDLWVMALWSGGIYDTEHNVMVTYALPDSTGGGDWSAGVSKMVVILKKYTQAKMDKTLLARYVSNPMFSLYKSSEFPLRDHHAGDTLKPCLWADDDQAGACVGQKGGKTINDLGEILRDGLWTFMDNYSGLSGRDLDTLLYVTQLDPNYDPNRCNGTSAASAMLGAGGSALSTGLMGMMFGPEVGIPLGVLSGLISLGSSAMSGDFDTSSCV